MAEEMISTVARSVASSYSRQRSKTLFELWRVADEKHTAMAPVAWEQLSIQRKASRDMYQMFLSWLVYDYHYLVDGKEVSLASKTAL